MTLPKYAQVAESIRAQIANGTLTPGQPAPSGAALARATGYSTLTCRRALRALIKERVLVPVTSPNARPRVAGPTTRLEQTLADTARAVGFPRTASPRGRPHATAAGRPGWRIGPRLAMLRLAACGRLAASGNTLTKNWTRMGPC
jgi:DNA-binding transcriptional MocR family regulator